VGAVTGIIKADGGGNISAATAGTDYVADEVDDVVGAISGIVKADGGGNISAATAGTDYLAPSGDGGSLTNLDGENIQADTIDEDSIDFGTGTDQVSAVDIPIADSGGYTTETDAEGAIQELYSDKADAVQYGYFPIPVAWGKDGGSPPDALDDSTRIPYEYRTFASDAEEELLFAWKAPPDMDADDTRIWVAFDYLVTESTGPTASEGVAWGCSYVAVGDNDATNGSKGTVTIVTDDALSASQWDLLQTDWSAAITNAGMDQRKTVEMSIIRDHDNAVDDYAQKVGLETIWIRYVKEVVTP